MSTTPLASASMTLRTGAPATLHLTLTADQADLLVEALNSHESALAADWELALDNRANARRAQLAAQMEACRALGHILVGFSSITRRA